MSSFAGNAYFKEFLLDFLEDIFNFGRNFSIVLIGKLLMFWGHFANHCTAS